MTFDHTLGVFLRPLTPSLKTYFLEFQSLALDMGFEVLCENESANMIGIKGVKFEEICQKSKTLVSIGGDGTLISVARRSFVYQKPILGINMGSLGFLTDLQKEEVKSFLPALKDMDYRIANHMMIEARIYSPDSQSDVEDSFFALNDIILRHFENGSMIHLEASVNKEYLNSYYGDGLIVATPTGSTAYNISAGGAVVYPFSHNLLLTPICAHSLTQRPLVLPAEFEIEIEVADRAICSVVIDGQENRILKDRQKIAVKALKNGAKLIHNKNWNYFDILRKKFHWGGF
ncbi:MAG: NAD(+)/NADH kinase [Helicobacter sp.]|nr:NAD(+)/NADH kinase [Helicobacter sp.]